MHNKLGELMGLDDEIILSDIEKSKWYLTIKHDPNVDKIYIIQSVINALKEEQFYLMGKQPYFGVIKLKNKLNQTLYPKYYEIQ